MTNKQDSPKIKNGSRQKSMAIYANRAYDFELESLAKGARISSIVPFALMEFAGRIDSKRNGDSYLL